MEETYNMPSFDFSQKMTSTPDDGRRKYIHLSNGQNVILESRDPHGFWYIKWEKGTTPHDLQEQTFTGFRLARAAVELWFEKNKFNVEPVEKPVPPPELNVKKAA
jgi:hypothetical protein